MKQHPFIKIMVCVLAVLLMGGVAVAHWPFGGWAMDLVDYQVEKVKKTTQLVTKTAKDLVNKEPVTIITSGDVMLGRFVETLLERHGHDYPFAAVKPVLETYDLAFTNLEGPIPEVHYQTPDYNTNFSFISETPQILKIAGFDVITLANNHTADKGLANFERTERVLDEAGLANFGHPLQVDASRVLRQEVNGHSLSWIGFHNATVALDNEAAVSLVAAEQLRDPGGVQIVSIHWGNEYQPVASQRQRDLAKLFVDAGADMIIGHHPHVVQDAEIYQGRAIFYSLGNFVFDQYFSQATQEGLMVGIEITDTAITYDLLPVAIVKSQPQMMDLSEREEWIKIWQQQNVAQLPYTDFGKFTLPR